MTAKTPTLLAATLCVLALTGLTGCVTAGDKPDRRSTDSAQGDHAQDGSAQHLATQAVKATKAARSLRLKGTVHTGGAPALINLSLTARGDCTGTVDVGPGTAEVRQKGRHSYVRANSAFYDAVSDDPRARLAAKLLKDRWAKVPRAAGKIADRSLDGPGDPTVYCELSTLLDKLGVEDARRAVKREATTVDGHRVIPLVRKRDTETQTSYVAAKGKPYLRKVDRRGGPDTGTLTFGDFGTSVHVDVPTGSDVVDLDSLGQLP